jgi:hypothetical protein
MKNIHLLSTKSKTRLYLSNYGKELNLASHPTTFFTTGQHIYITSDELIKEEDWCIDDIADVFKIEGLEYFRKFCKKIILTTDPDLIKNGVQAIDDEFLEWFVKNPRCEFVNIVPFDGYNAIKGKYFGYEIIIPKEKQTKCYCGHTTYCDCGPEEPKQETLEEAAERISPIQQVINFITENFQKEGEARQLSMDLLKKWCEVKLLNEESKWQQERSYSEDEVLNILYEHTVYLFGEKKHLLLEEWFEQFKNK